MYSCVDIQLNSFNRTLHVKGKIASNVTEHSDRNN